MNIEAKCVVAVKAIHITQVRYCACAQKKWHVDFTSGTGVGLH